MITLKRTDARNVEFRELVRQLDEDLHVRNGEENAFYAPFNSLDKIPYAVIAYDGEIAVGCGALKPFGTDAMEVKRMFVPLAKRGSGIATTVLAELEKWAAELNAVKCVLETGQQNPEAVSLYKKCGYRITPNYGQYIGVKNSICFEKML